MKMPDTGPAVYWIKLFAGILIAGLLLSGLAGKSVESDRRVPFLPPCKLMC